MHPGRHRREERERRHTRNTREQKSKSTERQREKKCHEERGREEKRTYTCSPPPPFTPRARKNEDCVRAWEKNYTYMYSVLHISIYYVYCIYHDLFREI